MKRSLLGVSVGFLAAAAYAQGPVYSANIVGFSKLQFEKGKLHLVATAFEDIDGKALKALDVFGTTQLPNGTQISYYDGSPYKTDTKTVAGWSSNITFNGVIGFWVKLPNTGTQTVYDVVLKGQVPMDGATTNVVVGGLNMLAYPYTADVVFSNTALYASSQSGDQLHLWNTGTTNYTTYTRTVAGWPAQARSFVITQGRGFWYKSSRTSPAEVAEPRPYPAN